MEALDSATMKWFVQAFQQGGRLGFNLRAKSAATVLRTIGKITGGGFLEAMAEFIAELNDLFGGFKERAARVQSALRSPEVAFVLVTSASPPAIKEVLYFAERLEEASMPRGAFVVNRFHEPPPRAREGITEADAAAGIAARSLALEEDAPSRLVQAHTDSVKLAALDAHHLRGLDASAGETPIVRVVELETNVHDLALLSRLADVLVA
jgi:anion-transporting  ArsA/GET3 family ATPase